MRRVLVLTSALLLLAGSAFAQCKAVPKPVRAYLKSHRAWSLVDIGDMGAGDRLAWRRTHRGACPGLAVVELGGAKEKSYALAVTNKAKDHRMERLILLEARNGKLVPRTLVPAFAVGEPLLVWRAKGRSVREFGSKRRIAIARDSVVFEKPGMSSKVFYLEDGKLRTVLVAD